MRARRGVGCLAGLLLVLFAAGLLAWVYRDDLLRRWRGEVHHVAVSPEAAASAEAKLERLRDGGDTARLTEVELSSLLRYRVADRYPELLQNPAISMTGETVRLGGHLPTERLPDLRELDRVRSFLPDTTRLEIGGRLLPLDGDRVALEIDEVAVAGIPIPQRFYPDVLERLGRRDEPGLPPNAIALVLPDGVSSARVENGLLVLTP